MTEPTPKPTTTHFGFRDVPVGEKQKLVGEVFSSVAGKYDLMNDLMSLGIHRVWKRYFTATAQVRPGDRVLDLAGGTGDIAFRMARRGAEVTVADINADMLGVGEQRAPLDRVGHGRRGGEVSAPGQRCRTEGPTDRLRDLARQPDLTLEALEVYSGGEIRRKHFDDDTMPASGVVDAP